MVEGKQSVMASKGWCGSGLWPRQHFESGPIWKQRKAKKQAALWGPRFPGRHLLLKASQRSQTAPPGGYQVFKHLRRTFDIQPEAYHGVWFCHTVLDFTGLFDSFVCFIRDIGLEFAPFPLKMPFLIFLSFYLFF